MSDRTTGGAVVANRNLQSVYFWRMSGDFPIQTVHTLDMHGPLAM